MEPSVAVRSTVRTRNKFAERTSAYLCHSRRSSNTGIFVAAISVTTLSNVNIAGQIPQTKPLALLRGVAAIAGDVITFGLIVPRDSTSTGRYKAAADSIAMRVPVRVEQSNNLTNLIINIYERIATPTSKLRFRNLCSRRPSAKGQITTFHSLGTKNKQCYSYRRARISHQVKIRAFRDISGS